MYKKIASLEKALCKYMNNLDNKSTPQHSLFHYTNYQGLKGILKSKTIWLAEHTSLNDPLEIMYGYSFFKRTLNLKIGAGFDEILHQIIKSTVCFITSFCTDGDDLPMWRYYSDGAGFSISLKQEAFIRISEPDKTADGLLMFKVLYGEDACKKVIDTFLTYVNKHKLNLSDHEVIQCISRYFFTLLPSFKSEGFKSENELRFCIIRFLHDGKYQPYGLPGKKIRLPLKEDNPTPFIKDELKNQKQNIALENVFKFNYQDIDTIFVAPKLDFEKSKTFIQQLLTSYGATTDEIRKIRIKESRWSYK